MERNDDLTNTTGGAGGVGNSSMSPSYGSTGSTGSDFADDASGRVQQAKDAAGAKLGQAKEALSSGLGTAKEKASQLNSTLADKLDAGAEKLRQSAQGSGGAYAGGAAALEGDNRMGQLGTKAADALQGTATFLREGDLKATLEEQVRTNPARTLLVALGVGYVLGKALRNDR